MSVRGRSLLDAAIRHSERSVLGCRRGKQGINQHSCPAGYELRQVIKSESAEPGLYAGTRAKTETKRTASVNAAFFRTYIQRWSGGGGGGGGERERERER